MNLLRRLFRKRHHLPRRVTATKVQNEEALLTQNNEEAPEVKKVDPEAEKKRLEKIEADRKLNEQIEIERKKKEQEELERKRIEAEQKTAGRYNEQNP